MTHLSKSTLKKLNQYASRSNRMAQHIIRNSLTLTLGILSINILDIVLFTHEWNVLELAKMTFLALIFSLILYGFGAWRNEKWIKKYGDEINDSPS